MSFIHRSKLVSTPAKTAAVVAGCVACALLVSANQQSWREKAPDKWTDDDVSTILSSSPWVQTAKATIQSNRSGGYRRGPGAGGGGWGGPRIGIGGMGGGMGRGRRGGRGGPPQAQTITATVRWESALPIREALRKEASAVNASDSDRERAKALAAEPQKYVISVIGLPKNFGLRSRGTSDESDDQDSSSDSAQLRRLKDSATLVSKGKGAIFPEKVERDTDGYTLLFTFPRTNPITLKDKEVEFTIHSASANLKCRFKLKDMQYVGKLQL